jgi:hypothetical protein
MLWQRSHLGTRKQRHADRESLPIGMGGYNFCPVRVQADLFRRAPPALLRPKYFVIVCLGREIA